MSRDRWSDHPCEALSALVDGELSPGERGAVEAHLAACPVCRGLEADLVLLGRAVRDEAPPPVPAGLAARIRDRVERRAPERSVAWWRAPWRAPMPVAAAATLVVAALVWLAWPGGRPPGAPEPVMEDAAGIAPGAPDPARAPDSVETPTAPRMPPPTPVAEQPKGAVPDRLAGPVGAARKEAEPKLRRPAPAGDAVTGGPTERPAEPPLEEAVRLTRADADGEREGSTGGLLDTPAASAELPPAASPVVSPAPPASPPLEASPYVVRLLPDGSMSVRTRDYQCAVPIAPDDALLLARVGEAAAATVVATRGQAAGVAPATSVAPTEADRSSAPGAAPGAAASAAPAAPAPAVLSPDARRVVVRLVRERYRAVIEERCGPLPR